MCNYRYERLMHRLSNAVLVEKERQASVVSEKSQSTLLNSWDQHKLRPFTSTKMPDRTNQSFSIWTWPVLKHQKPTCHEVQLRFILWIKICEVWWFLFLSHCAVVRYAHVVVWGNNLADDDIVILSLYLKRKRTRWKKVVNFEFGFYISRCNA